MPNPYLNRRLRVTAHAAFGSPTDREPEITDLPALKISVIRHPHDGGDVEGRSDS